MKSRRRSSGVRVLVAALVLTAPLATAGCSASTPAVTQPTATGSSSPSPSATPSALPTTYRSAAFVLPFTLAVPSWLPAQPAKQQPDFVTWDSADGVRHLRVMRPVSVFRPGAAAASAVPADFATYLLGQSKQGAVFTDERTTMIDGHAATLVTATASTSASLDGSFGCPATGMTADQCFGFQPDLVLRMAVIDVPGGPLLVWLRQDRAATGLPDQRAALDEVLSSLHLTK